MPPRKRQSHAPHPPAEAHSAAGLLSLEDIERRYSALFEQTRDAIFLLD
jgi:hypothetical protein